MRFLARNRGSGDTDQQEQPADGFKAEVFDEDHRDGDGEHDEAGDTGVFLPLAEGHLAFGGIFGGDSFAHGAVGFERQAFLRISLDLRGIAHHVDDGDDEHGEQHQGAHAGAGEHWQLGDLLTDANRTGDGEAEGEAHAGAEQRHGSSGHAVIAQAVEERQEHRQVGQRQFRHTDEGGKAGEDADKDGNDQIAFVADGAVQVLHAHIDQAGTFDEAHAAADHKGEEDNTGGAFQTVRNGGNQIHEADGMLLDGVVGILHHHRLRAVRRLDGFAFVLPRRDDVSEGGDQQDEDHQHDINIGHLEFLFGRSFRRLR